VDQAKLWVLSAYEWPLLAGATHAKYKTSLPNVYNWPAR
jgi:hypothetical protein